MRAALLLAVLAVVAAASALNLVLGVIWLAALAAIFLARRRLRHAAGLVLVLAVAAGAGLARLGWLEPPPRASYAADESAWLRERLGLGAAAGPAITAGTVLRARLLARRAEELRLTVDDLDRRAAAAIRTSRQLGPARSQAPAEVAALEAAVGRLALTLTAPEFRDLDGRRRRLREWFAELEARLAAARDETEVEAVARALEPAAMAPVSFRALREDLARADRAMTAVVRALAGGGVAVAATARLAYDESRRELRAEDRYVVTADPPLRITRVDVGALRHAAAGRGGTGRGGTHVLGYAAGEDALRELAGGAEIALDPGATQVAVLDRRIGPAAPLPVRAALRPIAFRRIALNARPGGPGELLVTVTLGEGGGPEPVLALDVPAPRLEAIALPRHALHYASLPGRLAPAPEGDLWVPREPVPLRGAGVVELVPPTPLLRNPLFARLGPYLYAPNPAATLGLTALAALAGVLVRRPRAPVPPVPP